MRRISAFAILTLGLALLITGACSEKQKKVKVVPTLKPVAEDTTTYQHVDIAMLSRSLVDALRMGEKLDSASYAFTGILTDGSGRPLYTDTEGRPGLWSVEVEGPGSVVIRNLREGNLPAEDLRVYVTQSIGMTDSDVIDAGIAEGTDSVQAVIYHSRDLQMEMTLLPRTDSRGTELAFVTIAFIRTGA